MSDPVTLRPRTRRSRRRLCAAVVLAALGVFVWSVWSGEGSLLSRATKVAELAEWRGSVGHGADDWDDDYEWLSDRELVVSGGYVDAPHAFRFDLTHRTRRVANGGWLFVPAQAADQKASKAGAAKRPPSGASFVAPDGGQIVWTPGARLRPGVRAPLTTRSASPISPVMVRPPWQPLTADSGGNRSWQTLCHFEDGWHRLVLDRRDMGGMTDFPVDARPGSRPPEPHVNLGGPIAKKWAYTPHGILSDGRALASAPPTGPQWQQEALVVIGTAQSPGITTLPIALPPRSTSLSVRLSPDGRRLVWLVWPPSQTGWKSWLHERLPRLMGPPPVDQEIWVSKWDGTDLRLLGTVRMDRKSKPFTGGGVADVFGVKWMPDSKRISFIHGGALYAIDAGP